MQTIKELVAEQIAENQAYYEEHLMILKLLRSKDGKPINHVTFSNKLLNEHGLVLENVYDSHFTMNGKLGRHCIGYNGFPVVDADWFAANDAPYNHGALSRLESLKAIDVDKLQSLQDALNNGIHQLLDAYREIVHDADVIDASIIDDVLGNVVPSFESHSFRQFMGVLSNRIK